MKFSIIVPFYNVEKYIEKCLESIKSQSYDNYEVIIINDGSKEKEEKIVKKYLKDKRFKYLKKENGGLSDARNFGLKEISGDYLLFVDSDDYISKDLLKKLNKILVNDAVDIIKYGLKTVNEKGKVIGKSKINSFINVEKKIAIKNILMDEFIDPACIYAFKVYFWQKHKFKFSQGMIHEDFGLIPLVLSKAESIISLDYYGYNYLQREASIMSDVSYEKIKKRVSDFRKHYENHRKEFDSLKDADLLGYSSLATIIKARELSDDDRKEYVEFIKKEKLISKITCISFKRFLMKLYLYLFLEKYLTKLNREFYGG